MGERRHLDAGPLLAAAGAVLGVLALFLTWYEPGGSAWRVFEIVDALLLVLALAVLALVASRLRLLRAAPPVGIWAPATAFLALVVLQIVNRPPAALDGELRTGAWLALVAGLAMLAGALLSVARLTVAVVPAPSAGRDAPGAPSGGSSVSRGAARPDTPGAASAGGRTGPPEAPGAAPHDAATAPTEVVEDPAGAGEHGAGRG